jgi:DNA-binding transcriptional regulator YiaG
MPISCVKISPFEEDSIHQEKFGYYLTSNHSMDCNWEAGTSSPTDILLF